MWGYLKCFSAGRPCELLLLSAALCFSCKAADKPSPSCSAHHSALPVGDDEHQIPEHTDATFDDGLELPAGPAHGKGTRDGT